MKKKGSNGLKSGEKLSRTKFRRAMYKKWVVDMYVKGNPMNRIRDMSTEEFNGHTLSASTVHRYIHEAIGEWQQAKNLIMQDHKAIELEKINRLEMEAHDAYLRSMQPIVTTVEKEVPTPPKKGGKQPVSGFLLMERARSSKQTAGDARFLDVIKWCIEQRCKILGFDKPLEQPDQPIAPTNTVIVRKVVFEIK